MADRGDHDELLDALMAIPPGSLDYENWLKVSAGAKDGGVSRDEWDGWNRLDPEHYDERGNQKHWESLEPGKPGGATRATVFAYARQHGWSGCKRPGAAKVTTPRPRPTAKGNTRPWTLDLAGEKPMEFHPIIYASPAEQVRSLVLALFRFDYCTGKGDRVNIVFEHFLPDPAKGGKCAPRGAGIAYYASQFQEDNHGFTEKVIGAADATAGAWFRPNPVNPEAYERDHATVGKNGKPLANGYGDAHLTRFEYAVAECDEGTKDAQLAAITRLRLPWVAIIDSGNRSIHAIVKVGAGSLDEFHERFGVLRAICADNGLEIDGACRNPSRLSRLPGVTREGGGMQTLLATNEHPQEWATWLAWVEAHRSNGDENAIPSTLTVQNIYDFTGEGTPEEPPELIGGLMYTGGKALITGPPKAHKSMEAIHLALALATGGEWWGHKCRRSKVLYVNTELRGAEFYRRVEATRKNLGIGREEYRDTLMATCTIGQTVSGEAVDYGNICDWLESRLAPGAYDVLVIDPIYKLEVADEDHVGVNELLNRLDRHRFKMGCSIIYCHHTAKGGSAGKTVFEQGRGSGDWGGDADLMVAITELGPLREGTPAWEKAAALGIRNPANAAYQIDFGTRSFNDPPHLRCFKAWPLFAPDKDGDLENLRQRGDPSAKGGASTSDKKRDERGRINAGIRRAVEACVCKGAKPTRAAVYDLLGIEGKDRPSMETFKGWTSRQDGRSCFRTRRDGDGEDVLTECHQAPDGRAAYKDGRPLFLPDEDQPGHDD